MNKETDYELFRKESIRNHFPFDGIHFDNNEYFITKENCPPIKWLFGLKAAFSWQKVPIDTLSMKIRDLTIKKVGDIFLNNVLLYTIDLN